MADFLTKASARNVERLDLLGETIEVRGLSIGELVEMTRTKKGEPARESLDLTAELIARCCFVKGKPLIPDGEIEKIKGFRSSVFNTLNEAVTRVNGSTAGNSKATGSDD